MTEFRKVAHAERSPTKCLLCHSIAGPFIDTQIEIPVWGAVYICMANDHSSGCLRQMARFDGMVEGALAEELSSALADAHVRIADLEREMEEQKMVPMSEVVEWMINQGAEWVNTQTTSASTATVPRRRRRPTAPEEE